MLWLTVPRNTDGGRGHRSWAGRNCNSMSGMVSSGRREQIKEQHLGRSIEMKLGGGAARSSL